MSDLKKLMSQLRISKDESQDNNSQKKELSKNLFLKNGFSYKVRLLPYFDNKDELNTIKNVWYHYINNEKVICNGIGCSNCKNGLKPSNQKFINVKLIETDDKQYSNFSNRDYFIFIVPYEFYKVLDDYEKTNLASLFDIYDSPNIVLKATEIINKYGNKMLDLKDSFIEENKTPLTKNINNFNDEDLIHYIKTFSYNLDEEIKSMFKSTAALSEPKKEATKDNKTMDLEKRKEEIKVNLESSIDDLKANLDNITLDLNLGINENDINDIHSTNGIGLHESIKEEEVKVETTQSEQALLVRKKEIKQDIKPVKEEKKKETKKIDEDIDSFVADFMKDID